MNPEAGYHRVIVLWNPGQVLVQVTSKLDDIFKVLATHRVHHEILSRIHGLGQYQEINALSVPCFQFSLNEARWSSPVIPISCALI